MIDPVSGTKDPKVFRAVLWAMVGYQPSCSSKIPCMQSAVFRMRVFEILLIHEQTLGVGSV